MVEVLAVAPTGSEEAQAQRTKKNGPNFSLGKTSASLMGANLVRISKLQIGLPRHCAHQLAMYANAIQELRSRFLLYLSQSC